MYGLETAPNHRANSWISEYVTVKFLLNAFLILSVDVFHPETGSSSAWQVRVRDSPRLRQIETISMATCSRIWRKTAGLSWAFSQRLFALTRMTWRHVATWSWLSHVQGLAALQINSKWSFSSTTGWKRGITFEERHTNEPCLLQTSYYCRARPASDLPLNSVY